MCLIVFALDQHEEFPFILVANRDEFYSRPTRHSMFWEDHPDILAGKDLKAGGTWMGITRKGRFTAITNYRDPDRIDPNARSRGDITRSFLEEDDAPDLFLKDLHLRKDEYNGFNLLVMEHNTMYHYSNYEGVINAIEPGTHGLSNALLNTPWPKLVNSKNRLSVLIQKEFKIEDLLDMMGNQDIAGDDELPETGVPIEWERSLSAACIRTPEYGTCSTTAVLINKFGVVNYVERNYAVGSRKESFHQYQFTIER